MYNITYISNSDRALLVELNEALRMATTIEDQQKIREGILEIETKRKPLHACSLDECTELRTTIWDKFNLLNRTGKYSTAQQFKIMLQQIEIRQIQIHREMALAEEQRKLEEKQAKKQQISEIQQQQKDNHDASSTNTEAQSVSSRWTTGIGSLD